MSEANNNPEDVGGEQPMSAEDKFFGMNATFDDGPDDEDRQLSIEIEDDTPPEDRRPPMSADDDDDDLDEQMEDYSGRVKKRIDKLTYRYNEERRQKEAAEREREAAIEYTKSLMQQNSQMQNIIANGEQRLVNEFKGRAEADVEKARAAYAKAYEEGDTDSVIAAQEQIIRALHEKEKAESWANNYQQRQQAQQHRQQYQPPPPPQERPPKPSERAMNWAEKNKGWFNDPAHYDMTSFAYGQHQQMVAVEGVEVDSDEYYSRLNKRMRETFPNYPWEGKGQSASSTSTGQSTVVAPQQRNNGARPRTVRLKASEKALAKSLGISLEEYAKQKIATETQR